MKKTRICFVSLYTYHFFNSDNRSRFGGAEEQLYHLAVGLAQDPNFEVIFLVGDFGQPEIEIRQGIKLVKFYNPHKSLKYVRAFWALMSLWRLLKKIDADIYLQRAASLETGIVALFCRLNSKKSVYMIAHDEDVLPQKPKWIGTGIINSIRWAMFKSGLRNSSLVYAQHELQQQNFKRNYEKISIMRNSAQIIPNEVDSSGKSTILWVARGDDWKQPEVFLNLTQKFFDEKFVMIMPEAKDAEYFKKIKHMAAQIKNLQFIDFVPANEIDKYFMKAKIFVNTSKVEGFPNTFIHAMKTKTPILSLNVDPDGILEKYGLGFYAGNDEQKLTEDLKKLLADKSLCAQIGQNAYVYAKQNHDIKVIIEQDKKVLTSLLKPLP